MSKRTRMSKKEVIMRKLHRFRDGWTIKYLETSEDLFEQDRVVHRGYSCLGYNNADWMRRIENGTTVMATLLDENGERKATLLWGDAEYIENARSGKGESFVYAHCKQFDQKPRNVKGQLLISLQCCPPEYMAGDIGCVKEETRRVKKWWEALPLSIS